MAFPLSIFVSLLCFECFLRAESHSNVFDRYKMSTKVSPYLTKTDHLRPIHVHIYKDCPHQICEDGSRISYPDDYISRLVQEKSAVQKSFQNMLTSNVTTSPETMEIGERINAFNARKHEMRLCKSVAKTVRPLVMRNINNQWRYIVNLESSRNLSQTFQIEICRENSGCNRMDNGRARCTQRYREVTFMVYEDNQFHFDTFAVPDVCMCSSSSCLVF